MQELSEAFKTKPNIEAYIKGLGDDTILVEYMPLSRMGEMAEPSQATILSKNGYFSYNIPIQEPVLLYLFPMKGEFSRSGGKAYRPDEKYIVLLLRPSDRLEIEGDLKEFFIEYQVKGDEFNRQYAQVRSGYIEEKSKAVAYELELDSLMADHENKELTNELFQRRNKLNGIAHKAHLDYIQNNLNKELSAFYLIKQSLETAGKYYNKLVLDVRNGLFKEALGQKYNTYRKYTKVKEAELRIREGEVAPSFVLPALNGTFSLDMATAKYIVLDFWGSWCPPCLKGFPRMKEYYFKYKGDIAFIGINCNEKEEKWRNAVKEYELPWIQVINTSDLNQDVAVMYGIQNFPYKFILDKDKRIVAKYMGETDEFYKKLDELLAKK